MVSRTMPASLRAVLSVALVGLLSLASCDIAGSDGGPGPSPGILGSVPGGPLTTPPSLDVLRATNGIAALESNGYSQYPSVSGDGRFVAFSSYADNLVVGDLNGRADIFVRDTQENTTTRVSVDSAGDEGSGDSNDCHISTSGRYIVFNTFANLDLANADVNGMMDIYLHDRDPDGDGFEGEGGDGVDTPTTIRVSLSDTANSPSNNYSYRPSVSDDGQRIAFQSDASNLVASDTNNTTDIFVRVLPSTTFRVSVEHASNPDGNVADGQNANSFSQYPSISANGQFVSFLSNAPDLVPGDTLGYYDIFRASVSATPTMDRASIGLGGAQANSYCYTNYFNGGGNGISADGLRVVFATPASNLVAGDTNGWDVFVRDFSTLPATTIRVVGPGGVQPNDFTFDGRISATGTRVAFLSSSSNLGPDGNFIQDIFIKDFVSGSLQLASLHTNGTTSSDYCDAPCISSDGTRIVYMSYANNLVDNDFNSQQDIFLRDLTTAETIRVSVPSAAAETNGNNNVAHIASGGPVVAFESDATNVVDNDFNGVTDVFVMDAASQTTRLVSANSVGTFGNGQSQNPSTSGDGRFIAFESTADNFVDSDNDGFFDNDFNGTRDIFVRDMVSGVTVRVSVSTAGDESNNDCFNPSISADGRFVAFESQASTLDPVATGSNYQVFVHDRQTQTTTCVSVSAGVEGNGLNLQANISSDGRFVVFMSNSTNLDPVATTGFLQIFVHDRQGLGSTACVSIAAGLESDAGSFNPSISADGRFVAFESTSTNLDPIATTNTTQVFVRDRQGAGTTRCISAVAGIEGNNASFEASIAAGGRFVVFTSVATNLHAAAVSGNAQVFVRDLQGTGTIALISVDSAGLEGNDSSFGGSISAEGRWVSYISAATNLILPDSGLFTDVFIRGPLN